MTSSGLSQESLLRLFQGHIKDSAEENQIKEALKNVVYETAITANDHMLTAKSKLKWQDKKSKDCPRTTSRSIIE